MGLSRGIITGCDHNMEKFLPWWYEHLQNHCDLPVVILDYGLSDWGKRIANKIGTLIEKQDISMEECLLQNTHVYSEYHLPARDLYLYKPFGLLQSPFEHTVWLDIDCKVLENIDSLFNFHNFTIAEGDQLNQQWALENKIFKSADTTLFISGTLVFKKDCPVIKAWAEKTILDGSYYLTEDLLLSELIAAKNLTISKLPPIYNTYWALKTPDTIISHYSTPLGKMAILQEMMAKVCGVEYAT